MPYKKIKALVLLSGGLDSILAVKLLQEQGIQVEGVCFWSNFFDCAKARQAAERLKIYLCEVDISRDFLALLKRPKHGFGVGLNPCIDCHALMLKKAGEIMQAEKYDFVATGEVLGERPMSQHKQALKIVEREAGLEGYLLRPLSAKLLEPTIPENDGRLDREGLLDISGRSRKRQMALAKKYNIDKYPAPAGGCALTQEGFARRLKKLVENKPEFDGCDVDLVVVGRHFWSGGAQIILGRDQEENKILKSAKKAKDISVAPLNFMGPEALIRGRKINNKLIKEAQALVIKFSPKAKNLSTDELLFKIN